MAPSSLTCLAEVLATMNMTFIKRWESEHVASSSKGGFGRAEMMRLRSHRDVGFRTGGKMLSKPLMKWTVVGCVNADVQFTVGGRVEKDTDCCQVLPCRVDD